jgi:PTS system ascorbate-specific IIA component
MTLDEPVKFGDEENDPVDILIFAGAINREEHNSEVIPQIAELCDSDAHIAALRQSRTRQEMEEALQRFEAALIAGELD